MTTMMMMLATVCTWPPGRAFCKQRRARFSTGLRQLSWGQTQRGKHCMIPSVLGQEAGGCP